MTGLMFTFDELRALGETHLGASDRLIVDQARGTNYGVDRFGSGRVTASRHSDGHFSAIPKHRCRRPWRQGSWRSGRWGRACC